MTTTQCESEIERIASGDDTLGPPLLTDLGREQLRLYPDLLAACRDALGAMESEMPDFSPKYRTYREVMDELRGVIKAANDLSANGAKP